MNAHYTPDIDEREPPAAQTEPGRKLARIHGRLPALSPREVDARRIIHRGMQDPRPADAFRDLRAQLLSRAGRRSISVLVAPVASGRGGSFVAINLAAALAFDERQAVVLIDCNLRRPCLHERLGVAPTPGLTDYLSGRTSSIEQITHATAMPRLFVVPRGGDCEGGGEMLASHRMLWLMDSLRGTDDDVSIVLDTPAANGSPDARIASKLAEQSILVAAYGRDTPQSVAAAGTGFSTERFAGVVFNRVPA